MNNKDIIRKLGFPNKIIESSSVERIRSKKWECGNCGYMHIFDDPVTCSKGGCSECGGIFFKAPSPELVEDKK